MKISPKEWVVGSWIQNERDTKSPHIKKMIAAFNHVSILL